MVVNGDGICEVVALMDPARIRSDRLRSPSPVIGPADQMYVRLELHLEFETQGDRRLRSEAGTESSCLLQDGPAAESPAGPQTGGIVSVKAENDAATNQAHNARCHEPCKGQGGGHLTFGCRYPPPARHVTIGCCDLDSVTRACQLLFLSSVIP